MVGKFDAVIGISLSARQMSSKKVKKLPDILAFFSSVGSATRKALLLSLTWTRYVNRSSIAVRACCFVVCRVRLGLEPEIRLR